MRKVSILALLVLMGVLYAAPVWANCRYHTYMMDGRLVSCNTCCYFGNCTTTCY